MTSGGGALGEGPIEEERDDGRAKGFNRIVVVER